VDGVGHRVVGVMPSDFSFPEPETELYLPLVLDPADLAEGSFDYRAVGRLRLGVIAGAAAADLDRTLETFPEAYPGDLTADFLDKARLAPVVTPLKERIVGDVAPALWVLLGSVGVILLVACANVANLFLVRAEGRQRELAVRSALGAGRRELAGELLAESLVLALAGGAVGLLLALVGVEVLTTLGPESLPRLHEVSLDGRALAFTLALSLLAGLLFGLVPMLRFSAPGLVAALKEGSRGATAAARRHLARHALVVAQVALALVLLVASGLLVRSFTALSRVEPGFDPEGVLTLRLALPEAGYPEPADAARLYDALLERVRSLPGVTAAGAVRHLPLGGSRSAHGVAVEDFPRPPEELPFLFPYTYASSGYFEALGIPLLAGRSFEPADHQQPTGAVLVSAALARRLWPGQSALGERLQPGEVEEGGTGWYTVVGVVGDVRDMRPENEPEELVYYPLVGVGDDRWVAREMTLVVRTAGEPLALAEAIRSEIWSLDPGLPVAQVRTMEEVVARHAVRPRFTMLLLLLAAGMTLVLGAVGLYGVISYVVSQRTQEIGVRMALGADRGAVSRMVVGQGMAVAGLGILLGLAGALAASRLLEALLYGVRPTDPMTYLTVAVFLAGVTTLASFLPARRAAAVEPVEALRWE
jgi:predicted permease